MESTTPRLDGWKAIASYLGRDERTAQRWRQRGLPVHLVPGGKRGTVFAYAQEIDDWLTRHSHDAAPDASEFDRVPARPPEPPRVDDVTPLQTGVVSPTRSRSQGRWLMAAIGVLAIGILGSAAYWNAGRRPRVARAEITASGLVAWTVDGQVAFAVPKGELIPEQFGSSTVPNVSLDLDPIVDDVDGDGSPEVIAVLGFRKDRPVASSEVVCYSSSGVLQWRYRPDRRLRFGGREFDGPWRVTDGLVIREPAGGLRFALAFVHDVWWPSFVVSLDDQGRERLHHINSGHVSRIQHLQDRAADLLVGIGVNNEYKSAMLLALDVNASPTLSPQGHPVFTCDGCTGTSPATYILLPPAELTTRQGRPYNIGEAVVVSPSGVHIAIEELVGTRSHYRLSRTLEPLSVGMSDLYWTLHRQLEEKGELTHRAEHCVDWKGRHLKIWAPEGWKDRWVPADSRGE